MALRIKEIIKEKGLTIQALADQMGTHRVNLSNMINGNPTVETLTKIANALDVPITELFERPESNGLVCPNCGASLELKIKNHDGNK